MFEIGIDVEPEEVSIQNERDSLNAMSTVSYELRRKSYSSGNLATITDDILQTTEVSIDAVPIAENKKSFKIKSSVRKPTSKLKNSKSSKKVGFTDEICVIMDDQETTSLRTRSISLSNLSSLDSDDVITVMEYIRREEKKYCVLDKLVFKIVNVNWKGD
jgi:hypothetical protein